MFSLGKSNRFFLWILHLICFATIIGAVDFFAKYHVLEDVNHDNLCFTQGLAIYNGYVYETCGQFGQSKIRKIDMGTGQVLSQRRFSKEIFAEGLAIALGKIFILTWTNRYMIVLDLLTFRVVGKLSFKTVSGEGWGLAIDEKSNEFIFSDGSSNLSFFKIPTEWAESLELDETNSKAITLTGMPSAGAVGGKRSLERARIVSVSDPTTGKSIDRINELEWYGDAFVYANIWYQDTIIKIDTKTGRVVQKIDLRSLYPQRKRAPKADCLNGIAYDSKDNTFFLTGKYWPKYYRIKLIEESPFA
jgi:glutamine cyclotransferase